MKIGIITLYYENHNFGGLLQAYALQKAIEKMGSSAEQICYKMGQAPQSRKILLNIGYKGTFGTIKMLSKSIRKTNRVRMARSAAFDKFEEQVPHSNRVYDFNSIADAVPLYDAFIVGSDQVWNAGSDFPRFCLDFVHGKKKLSYAASLNANSLIRTQRTELVQYLNDFSGIAVREQSVANILKELTQKDVDCVVDPVFLLDKNSWDKISKKPSLTENYVLCYLLGDDRKQRESTVKFAKSVNCKLVFFPYIINESYRNCDNDIGDVQETSGGPEEFLGWIKNAQYIITDSFHAVAFSVIFHKCFFALPRYVNGQQKMNNRQIDFLESIGLQEQFIQAETLITSAGKKPIDYSAVDEIIARRRKESFDYLKTALGINDENQPI